MTVEKIVDERNIYDDGIYYRLFAEAELVRWKMADYAWSSVKQADVAPSWIALVRETLIGELTTFSATERFFADFAADVDFTQWLTVWLYEETKHPSALLMWLNLFGEKFDSQFMLQGRQTFPFMPSRVGTLATNLVSEMVAATLYVTAASQPSIDPVLRQICRNIGGDEARHAASFFSYARKYIARSETPAQDRLMALKVLYFWITPGLNARVGHPVNLLANRYLTMPLLAEALPNDAIRSAIDDTYKRACRVFEALLGVQLRDAKDVTEQMAALERQ